VLRRFQEAGWEGRLLDLGATGPSGRNGATWHQLLGDVPESQQMHIVLGSKQ
jgi:hypothetical protein